MDKSNYSGIITTISVADPDIYTATYGTVTLSIENITRPYNTTLSVDMTPFYIDNAEFFGNNSGSSTLNFDVTRCSSVDSCIAMFDATNDGGTYSIFELIIAAVDDGGLSASVTLTVNITQAVPTPAWLNLPGSVIIDEWSTGPEQIFTMQMYLLNPELSLAVTPLINIVDVDPAVNTSGGTYFGIDTLCYPPPTNSSIICFGLNLTSLVTNGTFDYGVVDSYNITLLGLVTATSGSGSNSISSSVIVNIDRKARLGYTNDTIFQPEDAADPSCIFDVSAAVIDRSGVAVVTYNLTSIDQPEIRSKMFKINGSEICLKGGSGIDVGSVDGYMFQTAISPYVLTIEATEPAISSSAFGTFTLTVSILAAGDKPILNAPTVSLPIIYS